ncbi:MAG: UTRA domain-containing protein, partial [Chloroflexota bacterium]
DLTGSVYALLASRYGVQVTSARESIRPVVLDAAQAALLHTRRGAPALFVERLSLQGSRPVEVRHSVIRGDRYLYSIELRGVADPAAPQAPEGPLAG